MPEKEPTPPQDDSSDKLKDDAFPLDLPQPKRRPGMWLTLTVIGFTIAGSIGYGLYRRHEKHEAWKKFEAEWSKRGPIEASGGVKFEPRVEIKVPHFRQADERWRKDKLGDTEASLAAEGCAVASAAMVLASYGADTDPGRLNAALKEIEGYVGTGWIVWEKAAEATGDIARKAYEDEPSFRLIDEQLMQRNPVIVRLKAESGMNHFVVIAGKAGYDYLAMDPGAKEGKGLYPLKEFGSKIYALRYYERTKAPAPAQPAQPAN